MGCGNSLQSSQLDNLNLPLEQVESPKPDEIELLTPLINYNRKKLKVAIIGCTHAGTVAAAVLRNGSPDIEITIFEQNSTISFLSCGIHLAIMKTCTNLNKMFYNSVQTLRDLNITVHNQTLVQQIDYGARIIYYKHIPTNFIGTESYDKLLITTGSNPAIPKFIRSFSSRILKCKNFDDTKFLLKLKGSVAILGAGHIGVELAYAFTSVGQKIFLIDQSQHIMQRYFEPCYTDIIEQEFTENGAQLCLGKEILSVDSDDKNVQIRFEDEVVTADYMIVAAGFVPNTQMIFQSDQMKQIKHENYAIQVNQKQETSAENIYAAGDCCQIFSDQQGKYVPLATHAIRQAAIAAYQILGLDIEFKTSQCSFGIQIFEYSLANTGVQAEACGQQVSKIIFSEEVLLEFQQDEEIITSLTIFYNEVDFRLLGCQVMGCGDVVGYIDFLSVCISQKMTIQEVAMSEMCYNPSLGGFINTLQKCCIAGIMELVQYQDDGGECE